MTIRQVRAKRLTGSLRVNRFGVASERRAAFSLSPGHSLSDVYAPPQGYVVERSCAETSYDLAVEVMRTGPGDARLDGVQVS